jgi:hypothetical protein
MAGVNMTSLVIGAVGAGLIALGVAALWRQSRATSCPKDSCLAGGVAVVLAWACLLAGIGLFGFAICQGPDLKRLLSTAAAGLKRWVGIKESPPNTPPVLPYAGAEPIVDRLIEMGYLKFVPASKRADVRRQLVKTATRRYLDSDWNDYGVAADLRGYPADNEHLAEGEVGKTILLMRKVLEQEGVKLDNAADDFGNQKYEVVINGQRHLIYKGNGDGDSWALALKRLLEIVNGLLEEAGSEERLYAIYGGNDGRVILLTPEMQDYLESIGDVLDHDWMPRREEEVGENRSQ